MTKNLQRFTFYQLLPFTILFSFFFSCINQTQASQENTAPNPKLVYDTIQDIQGNIYPVITLGKQTWMAKNLELTKFDCNNAQEVIFTNGIERGPDVEFYDNKMRYAYYMNKPALGYGVLYSYNTMVNCNLCPEGYRIPTKSDWDSLINYITHSAGKEILVDGNSGFNAPLGGRIDSYGSVLVNDRVHFWSQDIVPNTNERLAFVFDVSKSGIIKVIGLDKRVGIYIRCVKNK